MNITPWKNFAFEILRILELFTHEVYVFLKNVGYLLTFSGVPRPQKWRVAVGVGGGGVYSDLFTDSCSYVA